MAEKRFLEAKIIIRLWSCPAILPSSFQRTLRRGKHSDWHGDLAHLCHACTRREGKAMRGMGRTQALIGRASWLVVMVVLMTAGQRAVRMAAAQTPIASS